MKKILIFSLMAISLSCSAELPMTQTSTNALDLNQTCEQLGADIRHLNSHPNYEYKEEELSVWMDSKETKKGVILVLHGLNLRPSKMNAYAGLFNQMGLDVFRGSLSGHRGSIEEQKSLKYQNWLADVHQMYCLARMRAEQEKVPLFMMGFSLGGLMALDFLNQYPHEHAVQKMIHVAPAIKVHWFGNIPGRMGWLAPGLGLPSKNLKEYRIEGTTSLSAYRSMTKARDALDEIVVSRLNIPTLVLVDPDDELVSLKKIEKMVAKEKLDQWQIGTISNAGSKLEKTYHHLAVDEVTLGTAEWNRIRMQFQAFLSPL